MKMFASRGNIPVTFLRKTSQNRQLSPFHIILLASLSQQIPVRSLRFEFFCSIFYHIHYDIGIVLCTVRNVDTHQVYILVMFASYRIFHGWIRWMPYVSSYGDVCHVNCYLSIISYIFIYYIRCL